MGEGLFGVGESGKNLAGRQEHGAGARVYHDQRFVNAHKLGGTVAGRSQEVWGTLKSIVRVRRDHQGKLPCMLQKEFSGAKGRAAEVPEQAARSELKCRTEGRAAFSG